MALWIRRNRRLRAPALMLSVAILVAGMMPLPGSLAAPGDSSQAEGRPQAKTPNGSEAKSIKALAEKQKQMGERFQRFETVLLRLAELTAKSDPKRAALLKKAVAQSKQDLIGVQFERASDLLAKDRLGDSVAQQGELKQDLEKLLELLVGDQARDNRQEVISNYIRILKIRIREQIELQGQTADAKDPKGLAGEQGKAAAKTGELAKAIKAAEAARKGAEPAAGGTPGSEGASKDGSPKSGSPKDSNGKGGNGSPAQDDHDHDGADDETTPARKRIAAAEEKMRQAQQELEKARRENALEQQERAIDELKVAEAELERILRQLREEEIERTLALLEVRFRKMLEMQIAVYERTLLLDRVPAEQRGRNHETEAGRLSRRESQIVIDCNKALAVLKEEGTGVAMPMVLAQVRDDMEMVVVRLAQDKVDPVTQSVEEDIIESLEKSIDALQTAQKEKVEEKEPDGPDGPREPKKEPLLDLVAELKMIRWMQMQVNDRTKRFSKLVDDEQADKPALLEALDKLSEREQKIQRSTREISLGKNQ